MVAFPKAMPELAKKQDPVWEDFVECHQDSCAFCLEDVHFGWRNGIPEVLHEEPTCRWFEHCDTGIQFAMFTRLKVLSDRGQLERN